MNAKRQIQALNKYKFETKTEKQVAKYISSKLEMLGYKVPKYMQQGKITQKQLDRHLDRIYDKLERLQAEQEFGKLSKAEQNRIKNMRNLEKQIVNYNTKIAQTVNKLEEAGYSKYVIDYITGKDLYTEKRDKSFHYDKALKMIDINRLHYKDIKAEIKRIRELNKNFKVKDMFKKITDSKDENEFFDGFIKSSFADGLTKDEQDYLKEQFDKMNFVQKNILIKDILADMREKYEDMEEEFGETYDYEKTATNIFNRINQAITEYSKI